MEKREKPIKIDADKLAALEARLEALPVRKAGAHLRMPAPEELAALRKYLGTGRSRYDIAVALGVSDKVLLRWIREYCGEGKP